MERFYRRTDQHVQCIVLLIILLFCLTSYGDLTDLQTDLGDIEIGGQWIYGDLAQGMKHALEDGKPLFVLFR